MHCNGTVAIVLSLSHPYCSDVQCCRLLKTKKYQQQPQLMSQKDIIGVACNLKSFVARLWLYLAILCSILILESRHKGILALGTVGDQAEIIIYV